MLGIERIVIHACPSPEFDEKTFYKYNKMFYSEFFDLMEKYNITVMTENWDNAGTFFSTGQNLKEFIDKLNHKLLCACWDTAHCNLDTVAREIGQYSNIIELGNKLKGLHIADNFGLFHHHTFPFAGFINFDSIMQALKDVDYDGYFTFEASYTLLNDKNPYPRKPFEYNGKPVTKLLNTPLELKIQAIDLLYEVGKHILKTYDCYSE
jgi:sugar phosphate isomerase/epimerase